MKTQIRLSGSGGQGLILAGIVLAKGAVKQGLYVVQTQSYGPEARGGASRAEVIISNQPIHYPKVDKSHVLIAMSAQACQCYGPQQADDGLFLYDQTLVQEPPEGAWGIPFTQLAREETGKEITANMVALGSLTSLNKSIAWQSVQMAIKETFPPKIVEMNLRAFNIGMEYTNRIGGAVNEAFGSTS